MAAQVVKVLAVTHNAAGKPVMRASLVNGKTISIALKPEEDLLITDAVLEAGIARIEGVINEKYEDLSATGVAMEELQLRLEARKEREAGIKKPKKSRKSKKGDKVIESPVISND